MIREKENLWIKLTSLIIGSILALYIVCVVNGAGEVNGFINIIIGIFYIVVCTLCINKMLSKNIRYIYNNKKKICMMLGLSLGLSWIAVELTPILVQNNNLNDIQLTIESIESDIASTEVWITEINVDGNSIPLEEVALTIGWEHKDGALITTQQNLPLELQLKVRNKASIKFVKHAWSGKVKITDGQQSVMELLYDEQGGEYTYNVPIKRVNDRLSLSYILAVMVITIIVFWVMLLVWQRIKKKLINN